MHLQISYSSVFFFFTFERWLTNKIYVTFVFLFPLLLTYFLLVLILFFVFISHFILLCYELFNKIDFNNTTYNKLPNFWINYFFFGGVTIESNHQWTQIGSFNRKTHLKNVWSGGIQIENRKKCTEKKIIKIEFIDVYVKKKKLFCYYQQPTTYL